MKIGIDAFFLNYPLNGIGQVTTHLLERLQSWAPPGGKAEDCEFFLYLSRPVEAPVPDRFHLRVIPVIGNAGRMSKRWWEVHQLPGATTRDGCDLLLSLYQSATVMPRNFPHLMLVHDIIFAVFPEHTDTLRKKLSAWLTIRGLRRATHRVAVSAYTKNDLVRRLGLAAGSISVAHIAAAPELAIPASMERVEEVLKKYGLASGYIYHGGGFDQRKNARAVIEAFRLLVYSLDQPPAMPPLRLVLTGAPTPHVDELMQLVREWNLSQYVVLLGCVPQADLAPLYRGAALFVYPSRYEGFGLPLLEAMHQGVPVVASNVTSLPEVGGDAAIYCDPDRPADLAAAMHTILTDAAARSRLRQEGPPRAAMFTWDLFAAQFMECAMKLLPKA